MPSRGQVHKGSFDRLHRRKILVFLQLLAWQGTSNSSRGNKGNSKMRQWHLIVGRRHQRAAYVFFRGADRSGALCENCFWHLRVCRRRDNQCLLAAKERHADSIRLHASPLKQYHLPSWRNALFQEGPSQWRLETSQHHGFVTYWVYRLYWSNRHIRVGTRANLVLIWVAVQPLSHWVGRGSWHYTPRLQIGLSSSSRRRISFPSFASSPLLHSTKIQLLYAAWRLGRLQWSYHCVPSLFHGILHQRGFLTRDLWAYADSQGQKQTRKEVPHGRRSSQSAPKYPNWSR